MTKQLVKTCDGVAIVYHDNYKSCNRFVVTNKGKVVFKCGTFESAMYSLMVQTNVDKGM